MKKLLDINMWIALTLETHPHHKFAREWYEKVILTRGDLLFCRQTELGFLRLLTQEKVMNRCGAVPLTNAETVEFLTSVYHDPAVARWDEPAATRSLWLELARGNRASPLQWMDAYLAAFALSSNAEFVTFNRGFWLYEKSGLNLILVESS